MLNLEPGPIKTSILMPGNLTNIIISRLSPECRNHYLGLDIDERRAAIVVLVVVVSSF